MSEAQKRDLLVYRTLRRRYDVSLFHVVSSNKDIDGVKQDQE